ncbi:MAG: hypothetical protein NWR64_08995, partial [Haliea sp.]|nr:hypothetical protein [Haliea sp.]
MKHHGSGVVLGMALAAAVGCHAASDLEPANTVAARSTADSRGWPHYGGEDAGQHAQLSDITPENVSQLE